MVTLVLDRSNLELRIDGDALAVYQGGEPHGSIPLTLLERIVLQGAIRLDTEVLGRLAQAGVPTIIITAQRSRCVDH
jgi:CRISP-associated protein Cas1